MAKRFTDTGKWDKKWYRQLGSKLRDLRSYILDRCDHAGILEVDLDTFEHFIGEPVTMAEISAALRGNFLVVDDKVFAKDFIEFQYKVPLERLNPANKVHHSVLARLESIGIFKPHASPLQGAKDKEKEKDKDKDKEQFSANSIFESLPLFTREQLTLRFESSMLWEGLDECVLYHSANPVSRTWPTHIWGQKITSWLLDKKQRLAKASPNKKAAGDICGVADV